MNCKLMLLRLFCLENKVKNEVFRRSREYPRRLHEKTDRFLYLLRELRDVFRQCSF